VATQVIELALAAPQVASHRLMRLSLTGRSPSLRDRREFYLMASEKVEAFYESWNAMLLEMLAANLNFMFGAVRFWCSPWSDLKRAPNAFSKHGRRVALAVLGSSLAPFHRRAVSNARRLRRVRIPAKY
jgi:hypothetical protein